MFGCRIGAWMQYSLVLGCAALAVEVCFFCGTDVTNIDVWMWSLSTAVRILGKYRGLLLSYVLYILCKFLSRWCASVPTNSVLALSRNV